VSAAGNGRPAGRTLHIVFARNLRRLLFERGLSQNEASRRARLPEKTVTKLVNGHAAVTLYHLEALADGLDVTAAELLNEREDPSG
jgi:transcriptional regulator with XRE-family HTH domain